MSDALRRDIAMLELIITRRPELNISYFYNPPPRYTSHMKKRLTRLRHDIPINFRKKDDAEEMRKHIQGRGYEVSEVYESNVAKMRIARRKQKVPMYEIWVY